MNDCFSLFIQSVPTVSVFMNDFILKLFCLGSIVAVVVEVAAKVVVILVAQYFSSIS